MKRVRAAILCLAAALCLSACAETPERPVVAQKNQERLVEKAQSGDENRQALPEVQEEAARDYSFQFRSEDGNLRISAEADVLVPEAEQIPMYYVSSGDFPQELVTAVYDYLFGGEATWYAEDHQYYTKAMADADLARAREELAKAEKMETDTQLDEERRKSAIDHFTSVIADRESWYDRYPDEIPKIYTDSTFRTESANTTLGSRDYQTLDVSTDSGKRMWCHNRIGREHAHSTLAFRSATGDRYSNDPGFIGPEQPVRVGTEVPVSCDYTYEEAKALADGIFQAAGVPVRLVRAELLRGCVDSTSYAWNKPREYEEQYSAYRFCYSRTVDGIPVAVTTNSGMYVEDTNPCWLYERMYVVVDSGGISNLDWDYFVDCGEPVNADVKILSFDEAARIFEEMAPLIYQGEFAALEAEGPFTWHATLTVDRVELDLMRVRDGGDLTGVYVPTWVFYGTKAVGTDAREEQITNNSPWIILAVNAVDGSVIDVMAGY